MDADEDKTKIKNTLNKLYKEVMSLHKRLDKIENNIEKVENVSDKIYNHVYFVEEMYEKAKRPALYFLDKISMFITGSPLLLDDIKPPNVTDRQVLENKHESLTINDDESEYNLEYNDEIMCSDFLD